MYLMTWIVIIANIGGPFFVDLVNNIVAFLNTTKYC